MSDKSNNFFQTDRAVQAPDTVPDHQPNAVGTPEGDNEFAPDQPLGQLPNDAEQTPRGNAPDSYKGE